MNVRLYGDLPGRRGTKRTIRAMRKLVDEGKKDSKIIFLATRIVQNCPDKDYLCQARRIFQYVKKNIAYVRDPVDLELVRSPYWTTQFHGGDCDDQAVLFCALCEAVGLRTRFKTVKADPAAPSEFSHVYSQVQVPKVGWVSADTIVPRARLGWEPAAASRGAEVWGGDDVRGMGQVIFPEGAPAAGTGTAEAAATTSGWKTFGQNLMNAVVNPAIGAFLNKVGKDVASEIQGAAPPTVVAEEEKAAGLARYAVPAMIGGGILAAVLVMKRRKKR